MGGGNHCRKEIIAVGLVITGLAMITRESYYMIGQKSASVGDTVILGASCVVQACLGLDRPGMEPRDIHHLERRNYSLT